MNTIELYVPSLLYHIKSLQWLQNVGCLKKRWINLWFLISTTFFFFNAPLRWRAITLFSFCSELSLPLEVVVKSSGDAILKIDVMFCLLFYYYDFCTLTRYLLSNFMVKRKASAVYFIHAWSTLLKCICVSFSYHEFD